MLEWLFLDFTQEYVGLFNACLVFFIKLREVRYEWLLLALFVTRRGQRAKLLTVVEWIREGSSLPFAKGFKIWPQNFFNHYQQLCFARFQDSFHRTYIILLVKFATIVLAYRFEHLPAGKGLEIRADSGRCLPTTYTQSSNVLWMLKLKTNELCCNSSSTTICGHRGKLPQLAPSYVSTCAAKIHVECGRSLVLIVIACSVP